MKVVIKEGDWFGRRQVIRREGSTPKSKASQWLVNCTGGGPKCKGEHLASAPSLNSNHSCGCLKNGAIGKANEKHGHYKHPAYKNLMSAINRCRHRTEYEKISVSKEWLPSTPGGVARFIDEMGDSHFPHAVLDRIDNKRGYEPGNCRWTTQAVNQTNTKDGRTKAEVLLIRKDKRIRKVIAAEYGCSIGVISRIQKGETYKVYP